jgi:hypothetical protein
MASRPSRRPRKQRIVRGSAKLAAYAELLTLHEDAQRTGSPLLTARGEAYLRGCLRLSRVPSGGREKAAEGRRSVLPHWDGDSRTLWLGPERIKEFLRPAPSQEAILAGFESQGWDRGHVANPLPVESWESAEEAKARLHETIKNLNRGLPRDTIRFRGDGTGTGVRWAYCCPTPATPGDAASA